ncbi:MAG TPA: PAS domain S-box protein [Microcoleaceae cyanobacterium]|jgi:PAS domain S-box-containing protein
MAEPKRQQANNPQPRSLRPASRQQQQDDRAHESIMFPDQEQADQRSEVDDRRWEASALQDSEPQFRSLIENATDIIVILDQQGVFRYCSPSAYRVLGYTLDDVIGRSALEFVHPADAAVILQVLQAAVQNPGIGQPAIEYRVQHNNGSWCIFEAVATSLLHDPAIRGVVVNCHDITERKQVEEALRAANRQIANILESITDAFISLDTEWRFTYLNQRAVQVLQRSQAELLGEIFWLVCPDFVGSTLDYECHRALEHQVPSTFEEFFPTLNAWFEVRIFPSSDGLSIFFPDITDRKHAQAELLEMSTALGNAVEGIARIDPQGRYVALNRAYAAALGYSAEAMIGKSWETTVVPEDLPILLMAHQQLLIEGKAEVEVRGLRRDGSTFHQEIVMVAAYDWYDQLIGHHCFTKDITDRKQAEAALRQQAEREQLMSTIAHRIRQSLNLEDILNTTVCEVRQLLQADRVVIFQIEANQHGVITAESVEVGGRSALGWRVQDDWFKQLQTNYYCQGKNLVCSDVSQLEPRLPCTQNSKQWSIKALLGVPILHGDRLWGVLVTHQCSSPRQWKSWEVNLLEQLATQVAIAIQQSELYRQVQSFAADLEQQVQERTAQLQQSLQFEALLKRITDAVRDSLDEDQILQTAVQELALGLEVNGCDAALYDLEQRISTIRYEYIQGGMSPAKNTVFQMAELPELYGQLLQAQYFQFCRNAASTIRPFKQHHAALVCPMVDDQGVIGDLWLFKPAADCFSNLEIRLVQQVANQCAIAVRQARLYQAAQAQVAALEELNQLKDDFLSTVSHELRTPMSNMKMAIHMLKQAVTPERQSQYLEILQSECIREIELINDLLDLQRLEAASYGINPEPIELHACLNALISPFQSRMQERHQIFQMHWPTESITILSDRASLERVLAELLNNACKYTPPQGTIVLTMNYGEPTVGIYQQAIARTIQITVQNQAEIPTLDLPRVFDKFYRVPNGDRWKQGGTGLGLALVQRLVLQLGGTIQASSANGWTKFTVELPLSNGAIEP